ncbi:MAG: hypothetical protein QT05_C0026G0025 [archaeon GW2011_AR13]|nr:MAG: hypothetical protein QT05_C0026G0025 [archaeon GW2011_AR13]
MSVEKSIKSLSSAIKNVVLGFAIFILTMFVTIYGINTFYERPQYNDYCEEFKTVKYDNDYTCRKDFETASEKYSRNVFLIAVPLGILIIALGTFIFNLNPVGVGLMFGGIGTLIYGAGGYWQYSENLFKFLISLVGLGIVIWFAYRFNKK